MTKKILVLGGTGFIGRNCVEKFAANPGYSVHATWHVKSPAPVENVVWHKCDLREPIDLSGYDIVVQAAATTSGSKDIVTRPQIHVTDNAIMNSLIFAAAHEAKVGHVIFFSCTTMFKEGVITEQSEIDIHSKYFGVAHTKLYIEKLCEFYAGLGATKFTAIRHSNIYGPHDKFDLERSHVMGATITKVMRATETVKVWGDGQEARDVLYVDDLVDFVEATIEKQTEKFEMYNAGAGSAVKIKDLVQKVIDTSGKKLQIEYDVSAPTIPTSLWLDCAKARNELNWWPKINLEEGIKRTIDWWRANV